MSANFGPASNRGNKTNPSSVRPTDVQKLEKKLSQAERRQQILSDQPIAGLTVSTTKSNGEGAVVIVIGQEGNTPSQLVVHRTLGATPKDQMSKWHMSSMFTANSLSKTDNPYMEKTQKGVTEIKMTAALTAGLLMKDASGQITYPDGSLREKVLGECREYADLHKKCPGGKPLVPTFAYANTAHQKAEIALLNYLAENQVVAKKIEDEVTNYIGWEATDPVTGLKLPEMAWAEGIPPKSLQLVILDVLRTGAYDKARWDVLKTVPAKKKSPFSMWGYVEGNYPAQQHNELLKALTKFGIARREYNVAANDKSDDKAAKAKKSELHDLYQKEVKAVNEAEKFEYEPHKPFEVGATEGALLSKKALKKPAKADLKAVVDYTSKPE